MCECQGWGCIQQCLLKGWKIAGIHLHRLCGVHKEARKTSRSYREEDQHWPKWKQWRPTSFDSELSEHSSGIILTVAKLCQHDVQNCSPENLRVVRTAKQGQKRAELQLGRQNQKLPSKLRRLPDRLKRPTWQGNRGDNMEISLLILIINWFILNILSMIYLLLHPLDAIVPVCCPMVGSW